MSAPRQHDAPGPAPLNAWARIIGWFVDRKFVVFALVALLISFGSSASPFGTDEGAVPVDAIPDIGENQQIIFTQWAGRSPRDVEDQISYPLTASLLGMPGVRTVRSSSAFGFSTIYVIFEDDIEFYWSRSRVLEKLASLPAELLPPGVTPTLGPDATALGQVFWYTLEGQDAEGNVRGGFTQVELRSAQDWIVRYGLQSVRGVSEVASIGGFVREYQIDVDPDALAAHGVSLSQVATAVRHANLDVGARTLEINQVEYMVRGLGFLRSVEDLEQTVVVSRDHTPVRISDVARVGLGPAQRRGALDDEGAPAVGGVVVVRYGENARAVIERVKAQIEELAPGLPTRMLEDGTQSQITIVPFYDRSELIEETLETLSTSLWQEILISLIVVLVLLRDLRSSLLIAGLLPLGVLFTFIIMKQTGVDANIMALGGIAIAIGTMVDMGIVFVENIGRHIDERQEGESEADAVKRAAAEVAPAIITSMLTTVVSFLPVFQLTAAEYKLFAPLAYTKSFAMTGALLIALLILPSMSHLVLGKRQARSTSLRRWARMLWALLRTSGWEELPIGVLALVAAWQAEHLWIIGAALAIASAGLGRALIGAWQHSAVETSEGAQTPEASRRSSDAAGAWPERLYLWLGRAQMLTALMLVTAELALDWGPMGPLHPGQSLLFVAAMLTAVLGTFGLFSRIYPQLLNFFLRRRWVFLPLPIAIVLFGVAAWRGAGSMLSWLPESLRLSPPVVTLAHALPGFGREYMPPFDEGAFLYMPTTMPHASIGATLEILSELDARIAAIPEVDRVVGKLGRVDSALDPAPISMIETMITYLPEYRVEADGSRVRQWREEIRNPQDIWDEITAAAALPGLTSAPVLMPIGARVVMLQSGMRAPMGIKVAGPDLESIERFGRRLEEALQQVPSIRSETVFADRVVGKPYLEIELDREAIGRYGLSIQTVQEVLQVALGGVPLTRTVEGRARYGVRVRYMREERDGVEAISRLLVPTDVGEQIPLTELAELRYRRGPQVIKSEDTRLTSFVLFDREPDRAEVEVVEEAQVYLAALIERGDLLVPEGVSYRFAGSYENQLRSDRQLLKVIPIALILILVLLYLQFRRISVALIIYSGVAVAVAGGFTLLWLYAQSWFLDFSVFGASMRELFHVGPINLSVAVWVGFIALIGVATDDGVVMATYLKQRFDRNPPETIEEIRALTLEAGMRRVRPCLMTTATTILALIPVITSQGRGSDVMVPMALPSVGGMAIELVTLFIVPVLFSLVEEWRLRNALNSTPPPNSTPPNLTQSSSELAVDASQAAEPSRKIDNEEDS